MKGEGEEEGLEKCGRKDKGMEEGKRRRKERKKEIRGRREG